jgi:dynein heavy chain, axonemal
MSREDFIDTIAVDVLGKLPVLYEIWRVRKQFEMNITPTLVVLLQELERSMTLNYLFSAFDQQNH